MLGTDCPFSGKECHPGCALFNTYVQQCNINIIAEHLLKISKNVEEIEEHHENNQPEQ